MSVRRVAFLLSILLGTVMGTAARAAETADQKAVHGRRDALTAAINRHDIKAVKGFYAPKFRGFEKGRPARNYQSMMDVLAKAFAPARHFHMTEKIVDVKNVKQ